MMGPSSAFVDDVVEGWLDVVVDKLLVDTDVRDPMTLDILALVERLVVVIDLVGCGGGERAESTKIIESHQ